jgi:probable addiction module antidote protein
VILLCGGDKSTQAADIRTARGYWSRYKQERKVPTVDYKRRLFKDLKDIEYASGYLTACLEEGEDVFLLALRDVVQAHGGMSALARVTKLNRENLYDMLSRSGNPRLRSVTAILNQLGLELSFKPKSKRTKAA